MAGLLIDCPTTRAMEGRPKTRLAIRTALLLAIGLAPRAALTAEGPTQGASGAAKEQAGWRSLFDGKSLGKWKPAAEGDKERVSVKDGTIILEKGKPMTAVTYRGGDFPKMDYEVTLEGKKLDGEDFFCTTTFPVGDSFCSLVVGGWGGTTVGLSSVDYLDASENETSTRRDFKKDQWYRVRIRVTGDKIRAWIDDAKVVDLDTADKKISIRVECAPCKPFGVATYRTTGAIRHVRVRTLTDDEKKAAGKDKE